MISSQEQCPDMADCPLDNQFQDGCCIKCRLPTPQAQSKYNVLAVITQRTDQRFAESREGLLLPKVPVLYICEQISGRSRLFNVL